MVTRRGFLASLAAALVAPDPERLLWRPGARLISIPRPASPISYISPEWLTRETLLALRSNMVATRYYQQAYNNALSSQAEIMGTVRHLVYPKRFRSVA